MAALDVIHGFAIGEPPLFHKFRAARLQVAWNILAENVGTSNHAARLVWAQKIFDDYDAEVASEYRQCLSHANIQAAGNSITDANLIAAVASFVDGWTGA